MRLSLLLFLCFFAACQAPPKGITDEQQIRFQILRRQWEPINAKYLAVADELSKTCVAIGQVVAIVDDRAKCVDKPKEEKPKEAKK